MNMKAGADRAAPGAAAAAAASAISAGLTAAVTAFDNGRLPVNSPDDPAASSHTHKEGKGKKRRKKTCLFPAFELRVFSRH